MPKSDIWPGGVGLERMTGMDSAGSSDSVISANSGFSEDSLGHLSAEEKACLMFLEETIESLDTEEDSGLSNDEPDQIPGRGNIATKLADLSASVNKSKLNEPLREHVNAKPMQRYLVPTPLVLAGSPPRSKLGNPPDTDQLYKAQFTSSSNKSGHKNQYPVVPPVPLEVNVVIPPPTKPRDCSFKTAEGPLPRGPLSYDALVHLQRSASTKKTPLCPTVDHTIDLDKLPGSDRSHSEASKPKTGPPVVAPKPRRIPANILVKNEAMITSDLSDSVKQAPDPQIVRLEALQKLGLLRDQENETVTPTSSSKSHSSLDPLPNRFTRGPPNVAMNRSLHSSSSFDHYSTCEQQPASVTHPAQRNGLKAAGAESSALLDNHRNGGNGPAAQQVSHKPSNAVSYTVMVVPGMGSDRKEALKKLGLLKQ